MLSVSSLDNEALFGQVGPLVGMFIVMSSCLPEGLGGFLFMDLENVKKGINVIVECVLIGGLTGGYNSGIMVGRGMCVSGVRGLRLKSGVDVRPVYCFRYDKKLVVKGGISVTRSDSVLADARACSSFGLPVGCGRVLGGAMIVRSSM